MNLEIYFTTKLSLPNQSSFHKFVQRMADRLAQGFARYGGPDPFQNYMSRMEMEMCAYRRTGNAEHLYNIANYAHLEEYAPENEKFHYNSRVWSASRGKTGTRKTKELL